MDLTANSIEFLILIDIVNMIIGDIFLHNDKQLLNDSDNDDGRQEVQGKGQRHEVVHQTIRRIDV